MSKSTMRSRKKTRRPRLRRTRLRRAGRSERKRRRMLLPQTNVHAHGELQLTAAFRAGEYAGEQLLSAAEGEERQRMLQQLWVSAFAEFNTSGEPLQMERYVRETAAFMNGVRRRVPIPDNDRLLLPTERTVAAIITVMNEEETIAAVLRQLKRLPLHEIVVVLNGSTDGSYEVVRNQSEAFVIHYADPLGYDVGRAIGAAAAQSELLLFVDGDIGFAAEQLIPFVYTLENGADIALNDISPFLGLFSNRDHVTIMKEFINRICGRQSLGASSMTAIPHGMRKSAAEIIGYDSLAVPPKAQISAMLQGMRVEIAASVDVISTNKVRGHNTGQGNAVAEMIVGDHLEALGYAVELLGSRLSYADVMRKRDVLGGPA